MVHHKILLIGLLILILLAASVFSALETAIVAITEPRLRILQDKYLWAKYAYKLKVQLNKVLIFSLFGNSLFNVIFTTVSTLLIAELLRRLSIEVVLPLTTLFIAFFIVIFSEVIPKIIAARSPLVTLRILAISAYYVFVLASPFIWVINQIVSYATAFINLGHNSAMSIAEFKVLIHDSNALFSSQHQEILLNSLDLQAMSVKDVLIPLRFISMIDVQEPLLNIQKKIYHTHHARMIVVDGSIDNIIGFIHVRDILALENKLLGLDYINKIVRPINFIHDFIPIVQQINLAQSTNQNIFVVINEYGDILGIACLADMLAMVVGDFATKAPRQKNLVTINSEQQLIVDGMMLIRDLNKLYNLCIQASHKILTLSGMVLEVLNGIPNVGVCFRKNNLVFEVINVGQYWVERVKITILS